MSTIYPGLLFTFLCGGNEPWICWQRFLLCFAQWNFLSFFKHDFPKGQGRPFTTLCAFCHTKKYWKFFPLPAILQRIESVQKRRLSLAELSYVSSKKMNEKFQKFAAHSAKIDLDNIFKCEILLGMMALGCKPFMQLSTAASFL